MTISSSVPPTKVTPISLMQASSRPTEKPRTMQTATTFCCSTHPIPTSAPNSHLLNSFLQAISTLIRGQAPPLVPASTSHSLSSVSTNSSLRSSSSVYYSAHSQPLHNSNTPTTSTLNNNINFDLPCYPSSKPLPRSVIELETIKDATRHTRHFFHRYFAELQGSWHKKQMFPEESFAEIPWQRVEERWRGPVNSEQKGGEGLAARRGRIAEWVKRDEVGELGRQRIGWMCKVHGWGYWVREIRWEDDGEDEVGGEREEEDERFEDAEE